MPSPTTGGGALTSWTTLRHLADRGHETNCLVLHDPRYYDPSSLDVRERIERVRAAGVDVVPIVSRAGSVIDSASRSPGARLRRLWRPGTLELAPHAVDADAVAEAVDDLRPDAVFVYHFEALAASGRIRSAPRLAAVGDPSHLPALYRWRADWPSPRAARTAVHLQARLRTQPRLLVEELRRCEAYGAFAAHHAAWFRRRGAAACAYLRTPVPDPLAAAPGEAGAAPAPGERPRLLLLGHLKGIATLEGLGVFARMLPHLDEAFGRNGYDVRVAGGFEPPAALRHALDHPAVEFLGHSEEPGPELLGAHALVVPTSIPLGIRVRILTGFSYGCCVVAHSANALGIPELVHEENALLAGDPRGLAACVVRAVSDAPLRGRLEAGGRQTYERHFAPPVAAGRIEEMLEALAARRGEPAAAGPVR